MKIDYELVERIGATHYNIESGELYLIVNGYPSKLWNKRDYWDVCIALSDAYLVRCIRPIPPKPQSEYDYILVEKCSLTKIYSAMLCGTIYWSKNGNLKYYFDGLNFVVSVQETENKNASSPVMYIDNHSFKFYKRIEKPRKTTQGIIKEWDKYCDTQISNGEWINLKLEGHEACIDVDAFENLCQRVVNNFDK